MDLSVFFTCVVCCEVAIRSNLPAILGLAYLAVVSLMIWSCRFQKEPAWKTQERIRLLDRCITAVERLLKHHPDR